jgi:hypothetical protein
VWAGRIKSRAGSTVAFIRSQRRDAFYRAKPDGTLDEISLLEAADEFRAPDPKEKAIPLHAAHHDQINSALIKFRESVVAEALQAETVDATQGPNEQRALRYLDGFASLPFVNEEERALIQAAKRPSVARVSRICSARSTAPALHQNRQDDARRAGG